MSETAPFVRAPAIRANRSAGLLLVAGAVCGFGLGAFGLTVSVPELPRDTALPALVSGSPAAAVQDTVAVAQSRDWPAAFGTPAPPPPAPEPAAEPEPQAEPIPPLDARLRGLALDEDGGWALIDIDGQVAMVRPGSQLDDHHAVGEIQSDGVVVFGPEGVELLAFGETDPAERPASSTVRDSLARSYLRGEQDLFDMPTPLPPAGYVGGPGFQGPSDR